MTCGVMSLEICCGGGRGTRPGFVDQLEHVLLLIGGPDSRTLESICRPSRLSNRSERRNLNRAMGTSVSLSISGRPKP